jgi:hypothetical protein
MKIVLSYILFISLSANLFSQNCSILTKANNITPDKLCSPVSVSWIVTYTGVNNGGTPVQISYGWDDGTIQTIGANNTAQGIFQATLSHVFTSAGDVSKNYDNRFFQICLEYPNTKEQIVQQKLPKQ